MIAPADSRVSAIYEGSRKSALLPPLVANLHIAMEANAWPEASGRDLVRQWLIREMTASPNNKKTKAQWYEAAKARFRLFRTRIRYCLVRCSRSNRLKLGTTGSTPQIVAIIPAVSSRVSLFYFVGVRIDCRSVKL